MPPLPAAILRPHGRRFRSAVFGAALVAGLAPAWIVGDTFLEDDNFRVISASLFRSGQLRLAEWEESLDEHAYRSVLNLRGRKLAEPWYRQERAFTAGHDIVHYDVRLSADKEPSAAEMERLVALMRQAPKPLLIHCNRGSDRSGLAAALYVYAVEGRGEDAARRQLSLWYGHFPWFGSPTAAMERAFASYVSAHGAPGGPANRAPPAA